MDLAKANGPRVDGAKSTLTQMNYSETAQFRQHKQAQTYNVCAECESCGYSATSPTSPVQDNANQDALEGGPAQRLKLVDGGSGLKRLLLAGGIGSFLFLNTTHLQHFLVFTRATNPKLAVLKQRGPCLSLDLQWQLKKTGFILLAF